MINKLLQVFQVQKVSAHDLRINTTNNVVFIHIPKTGGTSLIQALGMAETTHIKAVEIFNNDANQKLMKNSFTFAVVRNPIDRFISLYNYAKMDVSYYHNNLYPQKGIYGAHLDYDLLKDVSLNACVDYLLDGKLIHDSSWNQWMPQYTWVYDSEVKNCLVDKIYKLEELSALKTDFKERFNWELDIPIMNASKDVVSNNMLGKEAIKRLKSYYKKDFELFDYPI